MRHEERNKKGLCNQTASKYRTLKVHEIDGLRAEDPRDLPSAFSLATRTLKVHGIDGLRAEAKKDLPSAFPLVNCEESNLQSSNYEEKVHFSCSLDDRDE